MIGYYVHHQGRGHLHRATALAAALPEPVVGLSSLPRPRDWAGDWVELERDDEGAAGDPASDVTARGTLHWVPLGDAGLRSRMARVSDFLQRAAPRVLVVDLSVEVALLARLHGVPVVSVVLPGSRGDGPHLLGFDVATTLVSFWPDAVHVPGGMLRDVPESVRERVHPVGALSRFPVREPGERRPGPPRVTYLAGAGGSGGRDRAALEAARGETPRWEWTVLGTDRGTWVEDPRQVLEDADVVVTHAGQNALAEVAAARRPAVVVPQPRPHEEQVTTAAVLAAGDWPVLVEDELPACGWPERLERAAALDGGRWAGWCDGGAAARFAEVVA